MARLNRTQRPGERGSVLLVSLVLLVVLTILGLSSLRVTGMEELMAGATRERNQAFQAAEVALRAGEDRAQIADELDFGTVGGLYPRGARVNPLDPALWGEETSIASDATLTDVGAAPRFVVEDLGMLADTGSGGEASEVTGLRYLPEGQVRAYRVVSRGTGFSGAGVVVLESTYLAHQE